MNYDNYQLFLQAREHLKQKNINKALEILRYINQKDPLDIKVRFELARVLINKIETRQEGKNILLSLLNTENKEYALLQLGKIYAKEGENDKARWNFEQLLKTPSRTYAMLELGKLYAKEGKNDKAGWNFEQLLKTPSRTYAMLELGKLYAKEGKNDKARWNFEQLLKTTSRTYAMLELGKLYAKEGKNKEAKCYFEQLINERSQNKEYAMLELGRLYSNEGKNENARYCFEKLIDENTCGKEYAMLELGRLYFNEGKIANAKCLFEQLLKTQNKEYALLQLGKLYASEGKNDSARYCFEQLINEKSQNKEYAMMEIVFLNIKEKKLQQAEQLLESISKNTIKFSIYKNIQTYIQYKLGKLYNQNNDSYFAKQLLNYSKEATIEHIKNHLDENGQKKNHTIFDHDVNLYDLLEKIENQIKYITPIEYSIVEKYVICCEDVIAHIDDNEVRHVEVVTLPHSKNILTIYPKRIMNPQKNKTKQIEIK